MGQSFEETAAVIASIAKGFHSRGWVIGTSGNLSAVVSRDPLRLAITPSGADKGELVPEQILLIDEHELVVSGHQAKPSDETRLHLRIVRERGAGAVFHTHSIWNTILSDRYAPDGGLTIEGFEMLKGLHGVPTHEHREWLPILQNSQDMTELAERLGGTLTSNTQSHGVLLRRHGLYSWGDTPAEAKRHVEILEFLLEVMGRTLPAETRKV